MPSYRDEHSPHWPVHGNVVERYTSYCQAKESHNSNYSARTHSQYREYVYSGQLSTQQHREGGGRGGRGSLIALELNSITQMGKMYEAHTRGVHTQQQQHTLLTRLAIINFERFLGI